MRSGIVGLGLALAVGLVAPWPAFAQDDPPAPPPKVLWSNSQKFKIPVTLSSKNPGQVREMVLYVSDNLGYDWKRGGRSTPENPMFDFRAPRDGEYWFAVQTVDIQGKLYPSGDRQVQPTLRVLVDSTKPSIRLEPAQRRGSEAAVRWEVQDAHLLLRTLTLEYQIEGATSWRQVPLTATDQKLIGVKAWDAGSPDTLRVRMSVADRAGNVQVAELVLPDGLAANPGPALASARPAPPTVSPIAARPAATSQGDEEDPFGPADSAAPPPRSAPPVNEELPPPSRPRERERDREPERDPDFDPEPSAPAPAAGTRPVGPAGPTLLVGSPRFPLRYEIEDAGPNGPGLVELWTTRDGGRTWNRQPEDPDRTSPYNVDLGGEGTYGLYLVVQSSAGLGDAPPAPGQRPQSWVEVDSSPPYVAMDRPRVGRNGNAGKVLITWRASDPHLAPRPISIYYRPEGADAPWVPIAEGLENSGRYMWVTPANVPARIHIKVEAADTAGHRGADDTQTTYGPVLIDRARPKGRIVGLDAGAGTARQ